MVKTILTLITLLFCLGQPLMAAQITAIADRDSIGEGESLNLELRIDSKPDADPDLSILEQDWDILNRSTNSQTQYINGHLSRSYVVSLTLMPKRSGEVVIPPVCFGQDCSAALPINVSQQQAAVSGDELILETSAEPRSVVVGQQIMLTLKIMSRINLGNASLDEVTPEGVSATIEQFGEDQSYQMRLDGNLYGIIERRYLVYADEPGTLIIPQLSLLAQEASIRFSGSTRSLRRSSEPLSIEVKDKPAGNTGKDWIPARQLTLTDSWQEQQPQFKVGEPVTRTLTLSAAGIPANRLPELELPIPSGWKAYPDQPSRNDVKDDNGITGTLRQKIALVPTNSGEATLPGLDLDWYDTTSSSWRTAQLPPLTVEVAPNPVAVTSSVPPLQQTLTNAPVTPQEIPTTQQLEGNEALTLAANRPTLWICTCLGLLIAWLATLLLWFRSAHKRSTASSAAQTADADQTGNEKKAFNALLTAAKTNDPATTRQALLNWGRSHWPEQKLVHLEQLAELVGPQLSAELDGLNQARYAAEADSWDGRSLVDTLNDWHKTSTQKAGNKNDLKELYP
jgi:hypothetical protein